MFEIYTRIKNDRFFVFLCFVLSIGFLQAQEPKSTSDVEKIYLHTDKSMYFVGEDLFYKAYNVHATTNLLNDNSNILYVELISPEAKVIARNKTNIEIGLGNGDFQLTDSLIVKPGVYQLRAYTNWNRNYGENFVFKKNIEIIDVFEAHSNTTKTQKTAVENVVASIGKPNSFQVDFFPEGGSLIENVASFVGFKAVDSSGNPMDIKGEVFDSNNELVTSFVSPHDGMGKFQIIPIEGKKYYAKITTLDGKEWPKQELPQVLKQGYLLSFRVFKGKNIVSIITNESTLLKNPNAALTVVCKAKGVSYFESTQTLTQTSLSFELAKDKTPDGISQITLFDSNLKPQSERLVYVENEHDLEVTVATDKFIYKPNEKVALNVVSKSKTGTAKSASFSVSVTDRNGVLDEKDNATNICSYFLLESDIRGKVYNPGYYFDLTNLKRLDHLDNLLLTQGWRDFAWKTAVQLDQHYNVEKGFTISGKVKEIFSGKVRVNNKIGLVLLNKNHLSSFKTTSDSEGNFKFENIMFSGKTDMVLNSKNEKGKYSGEILANPFEQDLLPISFLPEPIDWSTNTNLIVEKVFSKYAAFGVKPENILNEVAIVAKKKKNVGSVIGIPDNSYVPEADIGTFTDIFEIMLQKIPGLRSFEDTVSFMRYDAPPLFLINGNISFKEEISTIRPDEILKIEVLKGPQATMYYGEEGANGIIAVYIKPYTGNRPREYFHSIKQNLEGFYTARIFYSPTPEQNQLDNKLAVRNTVYWNPFVHPDTTGNATISYYNTMVETKVKVALEGITASGIPVVKNTYYFVKK